MRRAWLIGALMVALAATLGAATALGSAFPSATAAKKVYVVIATDVSWSDINATDTPTLFKLAGTGAVGNLNAKPRVNDGWDTPPAVEGALEISAGNWVTPEYNAVSAFNVAESLNATSAGSVYQRVTGRSPGSAEIAWVGQPPASRAASVTADDVVLGTVGSAINDGYGATIAIGNSDAGESTATMKYERPAALAAMDTNGLVRFGDVSRDTLASDARAPYGVRTDLGAFDRSLSAAEWSASSSRGPELIVLDPGDTYRATRYAVLVSDSVAAAQWRAALGTLDRVVALALSHAGATDLVIVAGQGPVVDPATGQQGFSPILVSGRGMSGYLTSSSTHRAGMVANPDIAASVLSAVEMVRPVQIIGNPITSHATADDAQARIDRLIAMNATVTSTDAIRGTFTDVFYRIFAGLLVCVIAYALLRPRATERWQRNVSLALKGALLALASMLSAGWVMFAFSRTFASPAEAQAALLGSALLLFAFGALVWRYAPMRAPVLVAVGVVAVLLTADQLLGAPLSVVNVLGYTPLQAARYYGIGNEAAALLFGALLTAVALVADQWRDASWAAPWRRFALPVLGAVAIIAIAAPIFGANFGVAIWGTVGLLVAEAGLNGRRLGWRAALLAIVIVAVLLGGFVALDVFGGHAQTHLARSLSTAEQGGISQLGLIISRKADTNARVFAQSTWWIAPLVASLIFIGFLRLRPGALRERLLAENPALVTAIAAGLAAGIVAFFTEDTGILIVTVMLVPLVSAAAWIALDELETGEGSR